MIARLLHVVSTLTFISLCLPAFMYAQPVLKPFIGQSVIPDDAAPVCPIPLAIDPGNFFELPGLHAGDTIPDFKLYTIDNDSVHIGNLMADGKPVLFIGGNYTCPKFRNHIDELNDLQNQYGSQVHIFIVYTVEAHPADPDISPYKGEVWELNSNINQGIIYHQPVTYLERKLVAADMLGNMDIQVPVLIDGPCNEWWESFALAPNPAFLVSPDGTIFKKQGWFDNGLYAISSAIDSILQNVPVTVPQVQESISVTVYAGPETVRLIFSSPLHDAQLQLFDSGGRKLIAGAGINGNEFTFNRNTFSPGIYFYTVQDKGSRVAGKLLLH